MSQFFPWQQQQWQVLQERHSLGRLPHAILLSGPVGVGKEQFAIQFAKALLCKSVSETGEACGQCRSCLLYEAGNHPDLSVVSVLEGKKAISVDQVRQVSHYLSLKSQYEGYKIVIVSPAEAMNINAANSLLKTLEEPAANALLVLVASRTAMLPATVRSRCQEFRFPVPEVELARQWLRQQLDADENVDLLMGLADGAPLRALQISTDDLAGQRLGLLETLEVLAKGKLDPVIAAKQWCDVGLEDGLYWFNAWLIDMVRKKTVENPPHIANLDIESRLLNLANQVSLDRLLKILDQVAQASRAAEVNLNPALIMEDLLIFWQQAFRSSVSRVA
jgi:DNA polymerase-3 subunit delta'